MDVTKLACILIMLLSFCLHISQGSSCKKDSKPTRCPLRNNCYCPGLVHRRFDCVNGQWKPLPCDPVRITTEIPTTTQLPTTEKPKTCAKFDIAMIGNVVYTHSKTSNGYPLGTEAYYKCAGETNEHKVVCKMSGWSGSQGEPKCSCSKIQRADLLIKYNTKLKNGQLAPQTIASLYCVGSETLAGQLKCQSGGWIVKQPSSRWRSTCITTTTSKTIHKPTQVYSGHEPKTIHKPTKVYSEHRRTVVLIKPKTTTQSPEVHHTEQKTVVIVSSTTGAILGALIILVVIVSCQRRLHYHRLRRARLRHRQDQDAFTAYITYHRDVRLMLPSYDEAMNQQQRQPPSFEEALEQQNSTQNTNESPSVSVSIDSPNTSASPSSETHSPPGNDSDTTPLFNERSSGSPTAEHSRFFRSLRTLFGGRSFRPDAIYCRFVPEENQDESSARVEERESSNNSDDDLTQVLTQVGLC